MTNLFQNLPIERPEKIFVEFANGDEVSIQKIYSVSGRDACIKILVDELLENSEDLNELDSLKSVVEELKEENEEYEGEIEDLKTSAEKQEKELESAENALEDFEYKTGFKTSARSLETRIAELADYVVEYQEKVETTVLAENDDLKEELAALKVDNRALAWDIERLEKQIESTNLEIEASRE